MPSPSTWASTLRLPKSTFPPRFFIASSEKLAEYNRRCTDELYAWQRRAGRDPTFVLHDGPPYANGDLHIGHALNKILKDITCRYQVLRGRRIDFRPGWDCHGLPIELKALQAQRSDGRDEKLLGTLEVRRLARELAQDTIKRQKADFREWAIMADWDNAWKTMDREYELRQLDVFVRMVEKGQVYRRLKPVYWSPSTTTALAEAELEYKADHVSTAAYVKFPIVNPSEELRQRLGQSELPVSAVIWTTTPWTLPANKAIAVHSQLQYVLVQSPEHGNLLIAEARLDELEKVLGQGLRDNILGVCLGANLVGQQYFHPLIADKAPAQPILHGDFVSADSGTGLVHVAPGHGMDDYKLCQEHGIEPYAPVDDRGHFTKEAVPSNPQLLQGQNVLTDGNSSVLALLENQKALLAKHQYQHKYPYDWRSKMPVITRSTRQWFADLSGTRETALQALGNVKFIPEGGRERLSSFVRGRSEWCISRQRAWGVPIPALYHKNTGEAVMTSESVSHIISIMKKRGTDAWWSDDEDDQSWILASLKDNGPFIRGKETMDVWFDSGTSWNEMARGEEESRSVADVYMEGTDQHRGWFQSSLLTKIASQASMKTTSAAAPFSTLVTHGFTLDQHGKKMSKSEGNVVSPSDISKGTLLPPTPKKKGGKISRSNEGFGPDALRLWSASCDFSHDVQVGETVAKAINGTMAKIRVTLKLLLGLLGTHDSKRTAPFHTLHTVDRMALIHLEKLISNVHDAYAKFEYHRATAAITSYINTDFSAFYIESVKDRLYASATKSPSRMNAQLVLWEIFKTLSHLLYPITPLMIEEALDHLPPQLQGFHPVKSMHGHEAVEKSRCITGQWHDPVLEADLPYLSALSATVKAQQESLRRDEFMGSSLQCHVAISLPQVALAPAANDNTALSHALFSVHTNTNADTKLINSALSGALLRNANSLEDLLVVSNVKLYSIDDNSLPILASMPRNYAPLKPVEDMSLARWHIEGSWKGLNSSHQHDRQGSEETEEDKVQVHVYEPAAEKCVRCWKYTVPKDNELEESMCDRCLGVLEGLGDESLWEGRPKMRDTARALRESGLRTEELHGHWDFQS